MSTTSLKSVLALALVLVLGAATARAQNPVQWSGSPQQSLERAREGSLPLLFWVTGGSDHDDDDELADAQEECFRDPVVVGIIRKSFVPVRVGRTSKVLREAERLGLPTRHGLYCAVVTTDGRLLAELGPTEVADPAAFAAGLTQAAAKHNEELFERTLKPVIEDHSKPKAEVRRAVQTVWRLGIRSADGAIIGLLARPDLKPPEKAKLYGLLAALGTQASIGALLERADDAAAAAALQKAEAGALEWLIPELPGEDGGEGAVPARALAAYAGAAKVCRLGGVKAPEWWEKAGAAERREEVQRLKAKAEAVLDYWRQGEGGR